MTNITAIATAALLANNIQDEFTTVVGGQMADAIRAAQQKQAEETQEELGNQMLNVLKQVAENKQHWIRSIRDARKLEKLYKGKLVEIDRALQYGAATGNFIPVLAMVGESYYGSGIDAEDWKKLAKIPDDWTPPATSES